MLAELVRLSYQHRAFYCYMILSVWIFLLVAGMYKYIGVDEKTTLQTRVLENDIPLREFPRSLKADIKTKKIFRFCNNPYEIVTETEGNLSGNLTLAGVLVIIRHGDRGPLAHIRNVSIINCGKDFSSMPELDILYQSYVNFLQNISSYSRTTWAQFLGPFHGFPMLPLSSKDCRIGQLTTLGITQLLKTGIILRNAYYHKLNLGNGTISTNDIVVYSTRYRRTVQSIVALLYGFLEADGSQNLAKITMQESQSYTFCNSDCACPAAEKFFKQHLKEMAEYLKFHPAVIELIREASNTVFEIPDHTQMADPHALKDALLTYICHGAPLPCVDFDNQRVCVKTEHVTSLFAYAEWESKQITKSDNHKKYGLLRAYGLLKSIVSYMLRIISEANPKIVLYSGHDKTLEYLATALGIFSEEMAMPYYASRFVVEVYRINPQNENHVASDFYFRVIVNGKDVTQKIPFCKYANFYTVNYMERSDERARTNSKLCPIETIIRQLHDDYFVPFNATNFKDACTNHQRR